MSIAEINSLYAQACSAALAGDYDTAIDCAMSAQLRLSTTPNIMRIIAAGQEQITWSNTAAIEQFIVNCRKQKSARLGAASGGFQQTKIVYTRPDTYFG